MGVRNVTLLLALLLAACSGGGGAPVPALALEICGTVWNDDVLAVDVYYPEVLIYTSDWNDPTGYRWAEVDGWRVPDDQFEEVSQTARDALFFGGNGCLLFGPPGSWTWDYQTGRAEP